MTAWWQRCDSVVTAKLQHYDSDVIEVGYSQELHIVCKPLYVSHLMQFVRDPLFDLESFGFYDSGVMMSQLSLELKKMKFNIFVLTIHHFIKKKNKPSEILKYWICWVEIPTISSKWFSSCYSIWQQKIQFCFHIVITTLKQNTLGIFFHCEGKW